MVKIPEFYDPARVGTLYHPNVAEIAKDAQDTGIALASGDKTKVHLLIIDMQIDFCHKGGSLYVPGAEDDIRRLLQFIYRNAERISHITCSLDSHYPFQIFHGAWWADNAGKHPEPFTVITAEDVEEGRWQPINEPDWSRRYVHALRAQAKKDLVIWPYHVPVGGVGNALDPELWSAVFWHSIARRYQPTLWTKGSIPKTEHYSILRPEISVPEHPESGLSPRFVELLETYDYIVIAGEAETHCVLETVEDLVKEFGGSPEQLERILILRDCMSPVPHPEIDFHAIAVEQFASHETRGVRFINSTDPLPF
jgi:nicotinamidase-related amidase